MFAEERTLCCEKRLYVVIVCATEYTEELSKMIEESGPKSVDYSREDLENSKDLDEIILLDLSTRDYRAEFFGIQGNQKLMNMLENVVKKTSADDPEQACLICARDCYFVITVTQTESLPHEGGGVDERSPALEDALDLLLAMPEDDDMDVYGDANLSQVSIDPSVMAASQGPSFWPKDAVPTSKPAVKKTKKKRRRDRNRPSHEIARLQKQVVEMESQLRKLRPRSSARDRELQILLEKNDKLKEKVQKALDRTNDVKKLLETQADQLLQALPKSLVVSGRNLVYSVDEDDAVFQVLARSVDCRYMDSNRVFYDAGLQDATEEIFDAQVATDNNVLTYKSCALFPYSYDLVIKAMAHRIDCEAAILPCEVESTKELGLPMGSASHLIVSKREVRLEEASFTIRMALKVYVEEEREVYVWDAVGDWPRAEAVPHVSTREYGWSYFTHMDSPDVTVLRSLVLVTPTIAPETNGELVERVMQLYRHTIDSRYQLLENTLVDGAIHSRETML